MSLIVLNSRGQDPAEFENHGFNIRLGKGSQMCLCGVNLNRPPQTPLQIAISDCNNNGWIVGNGGRREDDFHPHSAIYFRIKEGVYNIDGLTFEMTYAMNGNYLPEHKDNYAGMPISCWRATTADFSAGGLRMENAGAVGAEVYSIKCGCVKVINGMRTRKRAVLGAAGGGQYPDPAGANAGAIPIGAPGVNDIIENVVDPDWITCIPSNRCKNFILTDPLWNTSNDARPGIFSGAGPIPADGSQDGYTWSTSLPAVGATRPEAMIGKIVGGIVSSKWTGGLNAGGGGNDPLAGNTNTQGPQALASRWGIGGNRMDLYWTIGERSSVAAGYQILFYAADMRKDGNYKINPTIDTRWGELQIPPPAAAEVWEICIRPISTIGGPNVYQLEAWARQRANFGGAQVGAAVPATGGGAAGVYNIDENGPNQLYKHLPMFQAMSYKEQAPVVGNWNFRSICHNCRPADGFGAGLTLVDFTSAAANVNNALDFTACFSPTTPNFANNPAGGGPTSANPLRHDLVGQSNRRAAIAPCIGYQTGTLQEAPQATADATGVAGGTASRNFESGEPVAVIQIPNVPLHGECGAGSTIWGGSNGGQVLGVAKLDEEGSYGAFNFGMNVYSEISQTNWIDVGNMGQDALSQLKVKITDPTGRKLVGLFPDTTIWLKIRSREQGNITTGGMDMRGVESSRNY